MKEKHEKSRQPKGFFSFPGPLLGPHLLRHTQFQNATYTVTSDVEDNYSRARSTVELNREIKDHRLAIARAAPGSKLVENLIADKDKLSSIVFRRKSPEQREQLCARRIIVARKDFDRKLESVLKLEQISASSSS